MSNLIVAGQQAAAGRATGDDAVAALQQAMAVISAVCDYAQELDAQGFNAADAWLGHVLAQMPPALWPDSVALTAWDMLRKYRGQLAAAGIGYDQLPRPADAGGLEAGRREQAREQARGHARAWREQQYRQTHSYVRCDGDGEQVVLAFPYDPDLVAACRKIDGRRYDGAAKTNVFPFTSLPAVIELAAAHAIEVTADVRALAAIAAHRAAEHAAQPQVRLDERDGTIIIDASLDAALYEKVRELGGRWDGAARVHRVPGHHAPALAGLAGQHGLRVSDQVRQFAANTSARQEENRAAAGAFEADPVPVPGLAAGLALKPQQYPVVRFALAHRRVLIGDDMGWGKTLSSLAAVAADGAYPVVVVCRPSLTLNWAAEIRRFFPDLVVQQAQGTSPQPIPAGADVIIIGSAALAAKPRKTSDGGKEFGWVEQLKKTGPKALIIDEGQDTKERGANRSQACEQLAAAVIARDGLVLDLTGTAILNRPRELCQQLTILGRIGELGGPKAFLWRYCLSETSQWGASYDGARNLIELHDRLRAWGIMIRRSDDAALGLPPCREHVLPIPQAALDPAVMNRYRRAEADLLGFLADKARQAAARLGEDPDSAAVAAAMRASAAEHLVAINTLRQLAGQAKRGYVTGWVREHVAAGEKVMVAAHHRDEVDAYAAAFGGLKLQGGQPVAEKEAVKARFQQQTASQAPVIAVAIGAGGVGHTLTAAAIGIQAEQAWTPGETQQMKKRLHRIGQDRDVDYYITVAEGTIDEHLQSVVTAKQATLDAVLDGRSDTGTATDERSVAAELTWRLTQQGLGTRAGNEPANADLASPGPAAAPPDQHDTAPSAEWSWKWSGDVIKVYAGTGIAGRIYRDQGPRGTFYRAETASDPYRSLAVDREVAAHLTGIDAAVEALRADRDRDHQEPADESHADDDTSRQAAGQLPAQAGRSGLRVTGQGRTAIAARPVPADDHPAGQDTAPPASVPAPSRDEDTPGQHNPGRHGTPVPARAGTASGSGAPPAPAAPALPGICIVPGCGQAGRLYPAGTLCDTHRPGRPVPPPEACPECGLAVPAHAPGCERRPASLWPAAGRPCGPADESTVRHWQQADVDPDKVRAWCRDTGRDEPPARGALPPDLVAGYLAERGGTDIPLPGGPARDRWLAQRRVLSESFTTQLGPLTVVYGPCPRCGHPAAAGPGEPLPLCTECASGPGARDSAAAPAGASGAPPRGAGPGGSAGQPDMPATSSPDGDDDETSAQAQITGRQLRQAAHRYLEDGLLPVPAWGAKQNGECCCPRGAACDRPGKHPRSVHSGPGPHDYSWKPLACRTHAEIEQRFAPGGEYAAGNLMVAIPEGVMAIDRDDDDGGRAALARLAEELGELPPTLAHKTPHGQHLIYRTPPGWKGRAWVGKDPANPVPAGIDLRMPGQILMAAPSVVPGPDGLARYGPLTGDHVAALPGAYVTAWSPPQPQPRPAGPRVPVPPDSADRAVRYVHEAMTRIAADLASRQPGGRNAAAYAAGLKAGSLLGAARDTPGAEQAAAAWTDEQAEQALMDAAERNGYTSKDGQAEALRAIRSGLRNGLRNPRALPDFTITPAATEQRQQVHQPAPPGPPRPQRGQRAAAPAPRAGRWQDTVPDDIRRQIEAADKAASDRRRAAIIAHQQALDRHNQSATADTAAEVEETRAAAHAAHQAYTQDGRHITGRNDAAMLRWAASIIAQREQRTAHPGAGQQESPRMQANRAAVAANEAYKAGDLDQARQLVAQAAALDPSRAGLWQQHRQQIAARGLILDARAAHAEGDHQRAQEILGQARQLDPCMPAVWDGDLPALPSARPAQRDHPVAARGPGGAGTAVRAVQAPGPQRGRPGPAADGGRGSPQPPRPTSPARRDQGPAATAAPQAGATPSERSATATPRESRPRAHEATGDPDASTDLPGNSPAPWPSPDLRSEPETAARARQAGHEANTGRATAAGASSKPDPGARAAPPADWRDDIISAAREPWQPGPSWPDNPALHRPPGTGTPDAGIAPGEPDA